MDSNGLIELKEIFLKAEKENEEKLNKNGVKQISNGKGYVVLSKSCEPSLTVSSSINLKNTFGLEDAKIVCTNKSIDDNINMKSPPDPFVFLKMGDIVVGQICLCIGGNTYIDYRCYVAPCAAFAKYIKSYPVVGTVETTLEKKKGFTTRFKTTDDIKANVSVGFKGCEASLEVTTGYEYEETITSETTKTWKQTLTEGKYSVYQNVIVYAFMLPGFPKSYIEDLNKTNPGANLMFVPKLNGMVMFVPIYRDDPFTIHYKDFVWDPIEYNTMIGLLIENLDKWSPKTLPNE
ncbi:hypothetical protein ACTFIY_007576 [Dictyostelium cf. discoideum]